VGLDLPEAGRNVEVKPYAIAGSTTDHLRDPVVEGRWNGDVGVDVKYGLTANLTADFTVNTDFAQVEVDEQQVNLTRFNLFFPEKREFFLEGGGSSTSGGAGPAEDRAPGRGMRPSCSTVDASDWNRVRWCPSTWGPG
jgi:hypothetical protein